ncbi:MAG TPA: amino acid permease [Gemmatimonadales bacterium]|nr:amino acid permease [Gemmatimonadales bacterium]
MTGLQRQLGVAAMAALVIGEVIAIGIFLTPATMAHSVGSPFWLLIVWLLMGAMALSGALCYGALAARFPEAGGAYVYLREAFGPGVSFLYGWKCLLVMDPGITALLAAALASYVGYALGLSGPALKAVAIGAVLVLAGLSMLGVRLGARVMQWLMVLKVGALAVIALFALALQAGSWSNFVPFIAQRAGSDPLPGALAPALIGGFFAFGGWWEIAKLGGEAKDPARTMPRALALGVIAVTAIYVFTSAIFLYLVPLDRVTSGETFAAQAGAALFGPSGGRVFAAIVIVAILGSLFALLMALPRVYYAMARDGVFFKAVAAVHPRFGTPIRAVAIQATLASLFVLFGTFQQILNYFIFVTVVFLALTVAGLLVLRRREGIERYRIPGYPVTPFLFLLLVAVLLMLLGGHDPKQAALGVGVVALGIPVYLLAFRHKPTRNRNSADDLDSHHPTARSRREAALGD